MTKTPFAARPIVVVTGANGGVGYGICQRLLLQLCQRNPSDSHPQPLAPGDGSVALPETGYKGVTLIMACRNTKRADAARTKLLHWFSQQIKEVERKTLRTEDKEHARAFSGDYDVQVAELDLASFGSVVKFSTKIKQQVPYITHLVFNAGVASFKSIDYWAYFKQLFTSPLASITAPVYYKQHKGEISSDNLGWVWQSNVFGHFVLFRELEPLLSKAPFDAARVIWSSSLEASPKFYDSEDWQLIKTEHSYETAKYQIDLIATHLDQLARSSTIPRQIRHFVSEPGVCSTMISQALVGPFTNLMKLLSFYLGRWAGSPYHTIVPIKAAIAAVYLMLVPLSFILSSGPKQPVRYGAQTDRWGRERVGTTPVKEWVSHQADGAALVEKCDTLYLEMSSSLTSDGRFEY